MADNEKAQVEHDAMSTTAQTPAINNKAIIEEAAERTAFEHSMTVRQAVKYYRWAIFWCLAVRYVTSRIITCNKFDHIYG